MRAAGTPSQPRLHSCASRRAVLLHRKGPRILSVPILHSSSQPRCIVVAEVDAVQRATPPEPRLGSPDRLAHRARRGGSTKSRASPTKVRVLQGQVVMSRSPPILDGINSRDVSYLAEPPPPLQTSPRRRKPHNASPRPLVAPPAPPSIAAQILALEPDSPRRAALLAAPPVIADRSRPPAPAAARDRGRRRPAAARARGGGRPGSQRPSIARSAPCVRAALRRGRGDCASAVQPTPSSPRCIAARRGADEIGSSRRRRVAGGACQARDAGRDRRRARSRTSASAAVATSRRSWSRRRRLRARTSMRCCARSPRRPRCAEAMTATTYLATCGWAIVDPLDGAEDEAEALRKKGDGARERGRCEALQLPCNSRRTPPPALSSRASS